MTSEENLGDIYIIRSNTSDKVYIGQVAHYVKQKDKLRKKGAKIRVEDHFNFALNEGAKSTDHPKLYNAIRKYGRAGFTWDILETVPIDQLNDREIYWIKEYNSVEKGYNITYGGLDRRPYDVEALALKVTDLWKDKEYRDMLVSKRARKYDLPYGLTPYKNKKGEIVGYTACIIRNGIRNGQSFGPRSAPTMLERYDLAIKFRDEILAMHGETA